MSETFHAIIHATDDSAHDVHEIKIGKLTLSTLQIEKPHKRFALSYDDVATRFETLPRMFLEPDGSFVWVIEDQQQRFQLDGLLVDDGSKLLNVELKGTTNGATLNEFLQTLDWPQQNVTFQLVQHGVYVTEAEFRRLFIDNVDSLEKRSS